MDGKRRDRQERSRRNRVLPFVLTGLVAGMLGLSFAAVPLYRIFCQVTGFGGTTQRAETGADRVLDRTITVRFDANTAQGMGWRFRHVTQPMTVRIGETALAFYRAENPSSSASTGTATFNVTPEAAGYYFNKIECFCFTEQRLGPGESADMPVSFFIDPEIVNDPEARNIREITLSYTFFPARSAPDVAVRAASRGRDGS